MKNSKNTTIAVLCVTAALLGSAVLYVHYNLPETQAASSQSVAGDYLMVTGAVSGSMDMLYVTDTVTQKMNAYQVDLRNRSIALAPKSTVDIKKMVADATAARSGRPKPPR